MTTIPSEHLSEQENAWELIDEVASELPPDEYYQLTVDQLNTDIYESLKEAAKQSEAVDSDWALAIHHDVLLREAILTVGQDEVLKKYPLPPAEKVWERYPDGSTEEHVVMEEIDDTLERWPLYPIEVLRETIQWHKAAQAVFLRRFEERFGTED